MTSLLVTMIAGTIAVLPTETVHSHIECLMCDNEAGMGKCDETIGDDVTCEGPYCSVTSYVRNTAGGCQLSESRLSFFMRRPNVLCVAEVEWSVLCRGGDYRGDGGTRPHNILVGGTQR